MVDIRCEGEGTQILGGASSMSMRTAKGHVSATESPSRFSLTEQSRASERAAVFFVAACTVCWARAGCFPHDTHGPCSKKGKARIHTAGEANNQTPHMHHNMQYAGSLVV